MEKMIHIFTAQSEMNTATAEGGTQNSDEPKKIGLCDLSYLKCEFIQIKIGSYLYVCIIFCFLSCPSNSLYIIINFFDSISQLKTLSTARFPFSPISFAFSG